MHTQPLQCDIYRMKMRVSVIASLALLLACVGPAEQQQLAIMDRIEGQLKLPQQARPLEKYARYYSIDGENIVGRYIAFVESDNKYYSLPLGKRRWVEDPRNLPSIADGGCAVVNVIYSRKYARIDRVFCNGLA